MIVEFPVCYDCGTEGHKRGDPICRFHNKMGKPVGNQNNQSRRVDNRDRTPPKEGESEIKMVDGILHKWCSRCKVWNKGKSAHTTSEHVCKKDRNNQSKLQM
jgi:hypothetical protein